MCAASRAKSQQAALLQAAAKTTAIVDQLAKKTWKLTVEFVNTKRGSAWMATLWSSHRPGCSIDVFRTVLGWPANAMFIYNTIHEKQFYHADHAR